MVDTYSVTYSLSETYQADNGTAITHTTEHDTTVEAGSAVKAIQLIVDLYKPSKIKITKKG